jgi:hypothetical protein
MTFLAIVLFVIGVASLCLAKNKNVAQRTAERLRIARLRRHADAEIELVKQGDMAGVYGEFPPPPAMRGAGIHGGWE